MKNSFLNYFSASIVVAEMATRPAPVIWLLLHLKCFVPPMLDQQELLHLPMAVPHCLQLVAMEGRADWSLLLLLPLPTPRTVPPALEGAAHFELPAELAPPWHRQLLASVSRIRIRVAAFEVRMTQ